MDKPEQTVKAVTQERKHKKIYQAIQNVKTKTYQLITKKMP